MSQQPPPYPQGASPYPQQPPYAYPQAAPAYAQAPPAVVVTTCHTGAAKLFGKHPVQLQCPHCQKQVSTRVEYEPGALAWILVIVIFFLGGVFGCCLIPLCVEGCH
ncbi:LPS-induced tumor necrosis factor alpha factor, partial [Aphelenchoides avenae]